MPFFRWKLWIDPMSGNYSIWQKNANSYWGGWWVNWGLDTAFARGAGYSRSWVLGEKLEPISLQLSGTLQGMTSPQRGPTSDLSLSQQALISIWWLFKVKFYASTNTLTVTCNDMCMYIFIPICRSEICESTDKFTKNQKRNPSNL